MKYFAVAVIFGLFAISQAMPVEESRYNFGCDTFYIRKGSHLCSTFKQFDSHVLFYAILTIAFHAFQGKEIQPVLH